MKLEKYSKIISKIRKLINAENYLKNLQEEFPEENKFTLSSIYSQEVQRRVKKSYYAVTQPSLLKEYYERYNEAVKSGEEPGIILRMAYNIDFSPSMLAKLLLECYLSQNSSSETTVSKSQVNEFLRDTSKIPDRDLAYEIYLCIIEDNVYGPFSTTIKHCIGHEYEEFLVKKLNSLNISHLDEDILRTKGYDKTPDIILDIPIAVDGHVVNWIEIKALFGDEESHKVYLRDQFWSYWNRFGSGLVIYWFGFIEELDDLAEKGILLRDKFPENITFMDPLSIAEKVN